MYYSFVYAVKNVGENMGNIIKSKKFYIVIVLLVLLGAGYYFYTPKIVENTMKDVVAQINNKDFVTAKKRLDLARHINSIATRKYIKQLSEICIKKIEVNDYNSVKELIGFIEQLSPSKDTDYAKKLVTQGKENMKIGLYDKATKYFDIAVIFDPSLADIYLQKGKVLLKENANCQYDCDYSEMTKLFSTAINLDKNLAEAYAYRGITYYSTEETKTIAIEDFNKAISLNSSKEATAIAYCYRAVEKYNEKDFDGFAHDRNIALNLKKELNGIPLYYEAFYVLEQAQMMMCALYDRCEYIDSDINVFPEFNRLRDQVNQTNAKKQKRESSKNHEGNAFSAKSKFSQGNIYLKQGKYREAIDSYYEAKELFESIGDTENAQKAGQAYDEAIEMRCEFGDYCM